MGLLLRKFIFFCIPVTGCGRDWKPVFSFRWTCFAADQNRPNTMPIGDRTGRNKDTAVTPLASNRKRAYSMAGR